MYNESELFEKLVNYYNKIYFDRSAIDRYSQALMKKYKVSPGVTSGVILGNKPIKDVEPELLYKLAECADIGLNLKDYFGPQEIREYSVPIKLNNNLKLKTVFENVFPVEMDQYVTVISASELYELYKNQVIIYNTLTQRAPKKVIVDGVERTMPYVNETSVRSISNLMKQNLFISNDITLNVRLEDEPKMNYDPENHIFTLNDAYFDILDGYHRYQAIIRTKISKPDFDQKFILNIMHFSQEKAQRYVAQQDKKNKINRSYTRSLDNTRYETIVVNRLNDNTNSPLYLRIDPIKLNPERVDGHTMLSFMKSADAIRQSFSLKSIDDVTDVTNYLMERFNEWLTLGGSEYKTNFTDIDFRMAVLLFSSWYKKDKDVDMRATFVRSTELLQDLDRQFDRSDKKGANLNAYGIKALKRELIKRGIF